MKTIKSFLFSAPNKSYLQNYMLDFNAYCGRQINTRSMLKTIYNGWKAPEKKGGGVVEEFRTSVLQSMSYQFMRSVKRVTSRVDATLLELS